MNKRFALYATLILASVMTATIPAFAAGETKAPSDTLVIVAITGAVVGGVGATIIGWWNAPDAEKYSGKKLAASLLLVALAIPTQTGIATLLSQVPNIESSLYVIFLVFGQAVALGMGIDLTHSKLKN